MILDTSTTARRRVRPRTAAFLGAAYTAPSRRASSWSGESDGSVGIRAFYAS
ncbi:hypothetical protein [Nonomuraea sp. NPDC046570]|uniref:hypothetical protein n=1 Tax=Nonomuraea sp. NPDC046570 TaxID=3155255 RepID=UPI0033F645E1